MGFPATAAKTVTQRTGSALGCKPLRSASALRQSTGDARKTAQAIQALVEVCPGKLFFIRVLLTQ
jgi:hypothetical protein